MQNERIRQAAVEGLDALCQSTDSVLLVQQLAHCVVHGAGRPKALLLDRLSDIARDAYGKRPALVLKHALPAALSSLQDPRIEVRWLAAG